MKSFYIGQRVNTGKFGDGVVSGWEFRMSNRQLSRSEFV